MSADINSMSFDPRRHDLMRDVAADNRRKAQASPTKPATSKSVPTRTSTPAQSAAPAVKPVSNPQSAENKRLRAKVADQEAKLTRLRNIAVEMSKRSARMSNVPGYVLKNYADELIKQLNAK